MFKRMSLLAFASVATLAMAGKDAEMHAEEEHEDMPYMPQHLRLTSPPINFLARDGVTITQVNVDAAGQNILNDAANEPSLTIDPTNPLRMAVGWRQFANIASNFRQAGYAYTTDGGATWHANTYDPTVFRSDPVLDTTAAGTFHYNSLQTTFYSDELISTNWGQTWGSPNPATGGDKQWIAIDKTPNSPGFGFVHQWWSTAGNNYGGRQYSRSTNGGTTWSNPINVPQRPIWGTIAIDTAGRIYLAGTASGAPGLRVVRSSNANNGSVTPTFDVQTTPAMLGDVNSGLSINPGGLAGQVSCVADTGNSPYAGTIYILSSIYRDDNQNLDVVFAKSTNQGVTFSTPLKVNDDPTGQGHFHWFGTMSVAKNGRLDAIWLDTRHDPNKLLSELYYAYSLDGGTTWSANEQIAPAFNPLIGWPQQNKIGDYLAVSSANNQVNVIFPATWSGGQDVYYARIPAPDLTLTGTLTLGDWIPDEAGQVVNYEILNVSGATVQSGNLTLGAAGTYSLKLNPDLCHVALTVKLKGAHWLTKTVYTGSVGLAGQAMGVDVASNGNTHNVDNTIDIADYTDLALAFDATPASSNWNANADLNGDGVVDIADYTILALHFDETGD